MTMSGQIDRADSGGNGRPDVRKSLFCRLYRIIYGRRRRIERCNDSFLVCVDVCVHARVLYMPTPSMSNKRVPSFKTKQRHRRHFGMHVKRRALKTTSVS